jgi:hypothetical protein
LIGAISDIRIDGVQQRCHLRPNAAARSLTWVLRSESAMRRFRTWSGRVCSRDTMIPHITGPRSAGSVQLCTPVRPARHVSSPWLLAPVAEMGDGRHHDGFRRRVARQPIGHDGARHHPQPFQEFANEALRGECTPAALHQDVQNFTRVIDGPPQSAALPVDHQTEFIEVPDVRAGSPACASLVGRTPYRTAASRGEWLRAKPQSLGRASIRTRRAGSHRSGSRATRTD